VRSPGRRPIALGAPSADAVPGGTLAAGESTASAGEQLRGLAERLERALALEGSDAPLVLKAALRGRRARRLGSQSAHARRVATAAEVLALAQDLLCEPRPGRARCGIWASRRPASSAPAATSASFRSSTLTPLKLVPLPANQQHTQLARAWLSTGVMDRNALAIAASPHTTPTSSSRSRPIESGDRLAVSKNLSAGGICFRIVGWNRAREVLRLTFNVQDETIVAVDA